MGRGRGAGGSPPKDEGWLDRLANALKGLAGKAFEIVKAIVVNILDAILSFLKKTVGSVAENTWTLIVFVAGPVFWQLMQKFKKSQVFSSAFLSSLLFSCLGLTFLTPS